MTLRDSKLTFVTEDGRTSVSKIGVYKLLWDDFVAKESLTLKPLAC